MNERETINILCATDDNYAPYCGIMLTSLFENNKDCHFVVYVLVDGSLSNKNKRKYAELEKKYDCQVRLEKVEEEVFRCCPIHKTSHAISLPTYYRLLASQILPEDIKKVIYLDCDLIVNENIRQFWNIDIKNVALAAVKECLHHFMDDTYQRLQYPKSDGYFNAGVLLLNLDYWREHQVVSRLFAFFDTASSEQLQMMDQDVMNSVLHNEKLLVKESYNYQTEFLMRSYCANYPSDFLETVIKESKNAAIIHYCGRLKPWDFRYHGGAYYTQWEYYRKKSLWKHCRVRKPLTKYVKSLTKRYFFPSLQKKILNSTWFYLPEK